MAAMLVNHTKLIFVVSFLGVIEPGIEEFLLATLLIPIKKKKFLKETNVEL